MKNDFGVGVVVGLTVMKILLVINTISAGECWWIADLMMYNGQQFLHICSDCYFFVHNISESLVSNLECFIIYIAASHSVCFAVSDYFFVCSVVVSVRKEATACSVRIHHASLISRSFIFRWVVCWNYHIAWRRCEASLYPMWFLWLFSSWFLKT